MAVVKETSIHRYIGDTADTKPTSVPAGTTYLDRQTGILYVTYDGSNYVAWTKIVKLGANSGVDIGDVDVTSLPALVAGTAIIGSAKDAGPHQTVTRTCTDSADIGTAAVDITAAPTAGQKIVATDILVSTDTTGKVTLQMETSGTVLAGAYMAANSTVAFTLRGYIKGDTADKKLQIKHATAGANGLVTAVYFSEA